MWRTILLIISRRPYFEGHSRPVSDRTVFMFGYPKSTVKRTGKEIEDSELREYKEFAKVLLSIDLTKLPANSKALIEVKIRSDV